MSKSLPLRPKSAWTHCALAFSFLESRRFDEAIQSFQCALAICPEDADTLANLAYTYRVSGNIQDAQSFARRALDLQPHHRLARVTLALVMLSLGKFEDAWPLYEARMGSAPGNANHPSLALREWKGESLKGKSVLVLREQGFGDEIQFCRFIPLMKKQGASRVSIVCRPELAMLFSSLEGVDDIYPWNQGVSVFGYDYWSRLLSLPMHHRTTPNNIPATLPYLHPPSERLSKWAERMPKTGLKVGLVWKGNVRHRQDRSRSLPRLSTLAALWEVREDVVFISLQRDDLEEICDDSSANLRRISLGNELSDFADTAAVIAQLDLVISVDTASAHLAGALGVPCWLMLSSVGTDWRWMRDREDSPWYPKVMRLFRQTHADDWISVVQAVAATLKQFTPPTSLAQ